MKKISIVIPAYNEEGNLSTLFKKIKEIFSSLENYNFEIIFVNDGSTDSTQEQLLSLSEMHPEVMYIEFSRNFGHQLAVKAGMDNAYGDAVITMDADLQHPPEMIHEMISHWEEGYDIIYTLRRYPKKISRLKKLSSKFYYKLVNAISEIRIEEGSADFRLLDASVVDVFRNINEQDPFLRGLTQWMGFSQKAIPYTAHERLTGTSKYSLKKMLKLALSGITSFSTKPLYFATYLGFFFATLSLLYIPYVIWAFYSGTEIKGWASILITIVFFGGLQLIILGILGIYIGKIFKQNKNRPNYIIKNKKL